MLYNKLNNLKLINKKTLMLSSSEAGNDNLNRSCFQTVWARRGLKENRFHKSF